MPSLARAVRTLKPGLSTSHWYLASCSVPVTPEEHKKIWSFLGDDYAVFDDPLCLTVTCSEFAMGVQDYGFFWKLTSGWIPHSALLGWTVDTCLRQVTEAFMVQTAENCGVSAVAVHDGRRRSLRTAELISTVLATMQIPQLYVDKASTAHEFWYSLVRQWIHAWRQSSRPFGFRLQ